MAPIFAPNTPTLLDINKFVSNSLLIIIACSFRCHFCEVLTLWTKLLGGPHPFKTLVTIFPLSLAMEHRNPFSNSISKIMEKLQKADIINEEEDFLILTEDNLAATVEENRNSCFGKIIVEKEINIQNVCKCL